MGLLDKIKDLFTDEEEYDDEKEEYNVKIKEVKKEEKKEDKLPTFMREKIEKEEKKDNFKLDDVDALEKNISSRVDSRINNNMYTEDIVEIPKEIDSAFKFPVSFDDDDYVPTRINRSISDRKEEVKEDKQFESYMEPIKKDESPKKDVKVADLYKDSTKKDEHKFKVSPIISPIYGVLDKNYSKDEIKEIPEESYEIKRSSLSKGIDFESVRKKAYGSLSDDIKENILCENCELLKEAQEKEEKKKIDESYETVIEEEEKDITFGDATENYYDYGVEYEKQEELPKRRNKKEEEKIKIVNSEATSEKTLKEVPPVKNSINLLSTLKKSMGEEDLEKKNDDKKDLELTDDLFNLIDSMYDERND